MSDIREQGYAGVFVRVFANILNSGLQETDRDVIEGVSSIKYTHSERADDASTITIKGRNASLLDNPNLAEGMALILIFGYTSGKKQKRLVWIWDVQAELTTEGVTMRIEAYPKGAYLLLNSGKDVWNNTNLKDYAERAAEAGGLDFQYEYDEAYVDFQKGSEVIVDRSLTDDPNGQVTVTAAVDATAVPKVYRWKDQQVVEANRSRARIIKDMEEKEPAPDVVIENRDDKLILRKRHLDQAPYKSYTWKGEPGDLLQFEPRSNARINKKYSISNSVSTWNEEEKEYSQAEVGSHQTGLTTLGDTKEVTWIQQKTAELETRLKNEAGIGDIPYVVDGVYVEEELDEKDENGNPIIKKRFNKRLEVGDKVFFGLVKRGTRKSKVSLDKKFITVESDVTSRVEQRGFEILPITKENLPTEDGSIEDAAGAGANRLARNELDKYEANIMVLGDPELVSGKIITINGVGERYSGNWYIKSVTHEVTMDQGYICRILAFRDELNSLSIQNTNQITYEQIGLRLNRSKYVEDGTFNLLTNTELRDD